MITEARHNESGTITAVINNTEWHGIAPGSRFYNEIQEWVDAGNAIAPYAKPVAEIAAEKHDELAQAMIAALATGLTCSNGITMDASYSDISKLDAGYRKELEKVELAAGDPATATMTVRDHGNQFHPSLLLTDIKTMRIELGDNWETQWARKCQRQDEVQAAVDDQLMSDDEKRTAIMAISW